MHNSRMMPGLTPSTDVFVIGGGPAGLAAAIAARRRGFAVTVADRSQPPIDKACGEGIMPDGVAAAHAIGISLEGAGGRPFRGIRFCEGDLAVEAPFPQGVGFGIRRTALHELMVERAAQAGVRLLWGTSVSGLEPAGVRVAGQLFRARWIVGADGVNSAVRRWAGLDASVHHSRRYGFRRHYRITPWSDFMEIHWGPKCQIYVTPIAKDEICVALVSHDPHLRLEFAMSAFPEIASRLSGAEQTSMERGATSSTRKLRKVYRDHVALLGDASGAVDCITGEGLCLSFRQATALADCFKDGNLRRYQQKHRALARRPAFTARLMLALDWNIPLRQRVMRAFGSDPDLFRRMLAMHVGELSTMELAIGGLSMGCRLLSA